MGLSRAPLLAALLVAGCSQDLATGTCLTSKDCPLGEVCVGNACEALTANTAKCTRDDQCGLGEFCDVTTGKCQAVTIVNCTSDAMCPAHQRCQISLGVCVDGGRGCQSDAQCSNINYRCDAARATCVQCLDVSHCPSGWACTNNACVDPGQTPQGCSEDRECSPPNTVCRTNQCAPGCAFPGGESCAAGTVCDNATGRCRSAPNTCTADRDCGAPARICESMSCVPSCTQPGGLTCTGGNTCNAATGRCEAQNSCRMDRDCAPPQTVCESAQCVLGCGRSGGLTCGSGTVCDTTTGRCVMVLGRCAMDAECVPPRTVCEGGQCVPGCAEVGGIQCTGNTSCNRARGRCENNQTPVCTRDTDCAPPQTICDLNTGGCVAGCQVSGCTGNLTCNATTGRCETAMMPPPTGGTALNSTCNQNTDCDSKVCFDLGGQFGKRCVASCGSSAECPASYTCYDFNGAKMCIHSSLFNNSTLSRNPGQACTLGGQCKSNFCAPQVNQCVETCTESADCGGRQCKWYEVVSDRFIAACNGPQGAGAHRASCSRDTDCQSGACFNNRCATLCASTASCANGEICAFANYSSCVAEVVGLCLAYQPNFVKGCYPAQHGRDPVGARCTGYQSCRSGLCHTVVGQCTDVCSNDADCPSSHKCKVIPFNTLSDGTEVFINVCMTAAFN